MTETTSHNCWIWPSICNLGLGSYFEDQVATKEQVALNMNLAYFNFTFLNHNLQGWRLCDNWSSKCTCFLLPETPLEGNLEQASFLSVDFGARGHVLGVEDQTPPGSPVISGYRYTPGGDYCTPGGVGYYPPLFSLIRSKSSSLCAAIQRPNG